MFSKVFLFFLSREHFYNSRKLSRDATLSGQGRVCFEGFALGGVRRDRGDSLKKRGAKKARRSLRNRLRKNARARERGFFLLLGSLLRLDALDARDARARGRGLAGSDRVDICRDARAREALGKESYSVDT